MTADEMLAKLLCRMQAAAENAPVRNKSIPLSKMTLADLKRILTPKQLAYAQALASGGMSKVKAYRQAYQVGEKRDNRSVYHDATNLSQHPKVVRAVDLIRQAHENPALRDAAATRAYVLQKIHDLSQEAKKDETQLAAAVALGKTVGLFVDRKEVIHRTGQAESEREIVDRLTALAAMFAEEDQDGAIDVSCEPSEPASSENPALSLQAVEPIQSRDRAPIIRSEYELEIDPDL